MGFVHYAILLRPTTQPASARDQVSGNAAKPSGRGWQISLQPQQAEVLCLSR
jgi:hypothetical protein